MPEMYLVGGAVRDKALGLVPKDYDFTVVADSYEDMRQWLMRELHAEFFQEAPEFGTIRARLPWYHAEAWGTPRKKDVAADFVLARKDGAYSDGRHPDTIEVGTLHDDLARRDFTVNAMAMDIEGNLYDPFNGMASLEDGHLTAVGNAVSRLTEDALRVLRAIRFAVTKDFQLDYDLRTSMTHAKVLYNLQYNVSEERVREELVKCFKHDTLLTIKTLERFPLVRAIVFGPDKSLWLLPTMKE